jgi:hypothetical protein
MKRNIVIGAAVAAVLVVAALIVILVPFGGPSDQEARKKADTLFVAMRDQGGTATYQAVEPDGDGLVIKGLTLTPPAKATKGIKRKITVEQLHIRDLDWKNTKEPEFADIEFKGLRVPDLKSDPQFQEFSKVTGLDELVVSGRVKYRVDKAKQQVVVEPFRVTVDKMGTYTFTVGLEGINVDQLKSATQGGKVKPAQMMGMASAIRLRSLTLTIKDDGGMEKMFKFGAHKEKKTPEAVRKEALAKIDAAASSPMAQSKLASEAIAAMKKFVTSPGTLTISAKPSAPVALFPVVMQVMSGGPKPQVLDKIKEQLGLTITAE